MEGEGERKKGRRREKGEEEMGRKEEMNDR